MLKKLIAWITILGMLTVYGVVGDAADILSAALEATTASAQAEGGGFTIDESGVLTKYNGGLTVVVVPDGVKAIGDSAFKDCSAVTSISLPESVTVIENWAFRDCKGLTELELGEGLAWIGYSAFSGCDSLADLYLPESAASYDDNVFGGYKGKVHCESPDGDAAKAVSAKGHDFYVGEDTIYGLRYVTVGDELQLALYSYTDTESAEAAVPDYVERLHNEVFKDHNELTKVTVPGNVKTIENWAFRDCKGLTGLELGEGLAWIGYSAFSGCDSLADLYLPESAASYDDNVFGGYKGKVHCKSYDGDAAKAVSAKGHDFYVGEDTIYGLRYVTVGDELQLALYSYTDTESAEAAVPDYVERLHNEVFRDHTELTKVTVPGSVKTIENWAFRDCKGLTGLELGEGLAWIGYSAFSGCDGLADLYLPESAASYDDNVFGGYVGKVHCKSHDGEAAKAVSAKGRDFYVGEDTIYGLRYVTVGDELQLALYSYTNTEKAKDESGEEAQTEVKETAAVVPDYVERLHDSVFRDHTELTKVTVPGSVKTIENWAFRDCKGLTGLELGEGLAWIGYYAFSGCDGLADLYLPESAASYDDNVFGGYKGKVHCESPDGDAAKAVSAKGRDFYLGEDTAYGLRYVTVNGEKQLALYTYTDTESAEAMVPDCVDRLHDSVFRNHTELKRIALPARLKTIENWAFRDCAGLTELGLSKNLKEIGYSAFSGCSALADLHLADGMTYLDPSAFYGFGARLHCESWDGDTARAISANGRDFYVGDDSTLALRWRDIDGQDLLCLRGFNGGDAVEVPDYVEYIDGSALSASTAERITVPESVVGIGSYAFAKGLKDAYLPYSIEDINDYAFLNCAGGVTLHVYSGSYAEEFAQSKKYNIAYRDASLRVTAEGAGEGLSVRVTPEAGRAQTRPVEAGVATFAAVSPDQTCAVELLNAQGYVLASQTAAIRTGANAVTFAGLPETGSVRAVVRDADTRADLTSELSVRWYDENGALYAEGAALEAVPVGTALRCEVALGEALIGKYEECDPAEYAIRADGRYLSLSLKPYARRTVTGTAEPAGIVTVTAAQRTALSHTEFMTTVETDAEGRYALDLPALDAVLTFSAPGCAAQTAQAPVGTDGVGAVALAALDGARVSVDATLNRAGGGSEALDLTKARVTVRNLTTGEALGDAVVLPGSVFLPAGASAGDEVSVEVSGEGIAAGRASATLKDDLTASVALALAEKGRAVISVNEAPGAALRLMVYDGAGSLVYAEDFDSLPVETRGLDAGAYTAALMRASGFVDAPRTLAGLEGLACVRLALDIADGAIREATAEAVPELDESAWYAVDAAGIAFQSSRTNVALGRNYTISASAPGAAEGASDFKWIFRLPEGSAYVENTLSVGGALVYDAEFGTNSIAVPVENLGDKVRFCLLPVSGGAQTVKGWLEYQWNGQTLRQPAGEATVEVEQLELYAQGTTYEPRVYVYGVAPAHAAVTVYDGGVAVGETETAANGKWGLWAELDRPGTYSTHYLTASYAFDNGRSFRTNEVRVVYQYMDEPVTLTEVKLYTYGHDWESDGVTPNFDFQDTVTFDFRNPSNTTPSYGFNPSHPLCHFLVKFAGDASKVTRVKVNVTCLDGSVRTLKAQYDASLGGWYAKDEFSLRTMPKGVTVHYVNENELVIDDSYADVFADLDDMAKEFGDRPEDLFLPLPDDPRVSEELLLAVENYNDHLRQTTALFEDLSKTIAEAGNALAAALEGDEYARMSDCSALDASQMEENGYASAVTSEGGTLYYRADIEADLFEIVDFSENQRLSITLSKWSELVDPDLIEGMQYGIEAVQGAYSDLLEAVDQLARAIEDETGVSLRSRSGVARLVARGDVPGFYDNAWTQSGILVLNYFTNVKDYVPFWNAFDSWRTLVKDMGRLSTINGLLNKYPDCKWLRVARDTYRGLCAAQFCMAIKDTLVGGVQFGMLIAMATGNVELAPAYVALSSNNKVSLAGLSVMLVQSTADSAYDLSIANDPEALKDSICPEPDLVNPSNPTDPFADPSGYVYEAVLSNRVEGATATVIQRVTLEDMYQEEYTEDRVWDAEPYGQVNPQLTNASGEFAWDVPEGLWSVKVSKPGYDDVQTGWMEVPPEYKDVHIALVNYDRPMVTSVVSKQEGIEVAFEKYVAADQLGSVFKLTADGEEVPVTVSSIDAEQSPDGRTLVTRVLVVPSETFYGAEDVLLTVSGSVKSYAGVSLGTDMSFEVDRIRYTLTATPDKVTVLLGGTAEVAVAGTPAEGLAGELLSADYPEGALGVNYQGALDDAAETTVYVTGRAAGETTLRLSAKGVKAAVRVDCVDPDACDALWLPLGLTQIDSEAFAGSGAEIVVIPASCASIASRAFADCPNLKYVVLAAGTDIRIADDAFAGREVALLYW